MRQTKAGFFLITVLLIITGLATLTTIGLVRSTTELPAAQRFLDSQRAGSLAAAASPDPAAAFPS